MLKVRALSKSFDGKTILDDLDFQADEGQIVGIVGSNGEGKTTLLNCLTTVLKPDRGNIYYRGKDIAEDLVGYKKAIAYTPDDCSCFDYMTGREFITFIASSYGLSKTAIAGLSEGAAKQFNFTRFLDMPIEEYSRGTKQKAALIASYIHHPDIWFLDEPMLGLDPAASDTLVALFKEVSARGGTVILTIHDLFQAERICTDVAHLDGKQIVKIYHDIPHNRDFHQDLVRFFNAQ